MTRMKMKPARGEEERERGVGKGKTRGKERKKERKEDKRDDACSKKALNSERRK